MTSKHSVIRFNLFLALLAIFSLPTDSAAGQRWFSDAQVEQGAKLFQQNCAACHGAKAEATPNWKQTDADGNYPPPPLNGSAHAWHHPLSVLRQTIVEGGAKLGGQMPGFGNRLDGAEIDSLIAYFQSHWPEDIYRKWAARFEVGQAPTGGQETARATDSRRTELLSLRLGNANPSEPVETPLKGIYETRFGSNFGYLSADGRYIIVGNLIDLQEGRNLTDISRQRGAIDELGRIPITRKAVFPAQGDEKAVLTIFTDTTCPYCKQLHGEVSKLQQAGISVHYLPYPRGGPQGPGYQELKQVWCAEDRATAMSIAKGLISGSLPDGNCASAAMVDEGYALGNRVGVTGTPALFKSNGEMISGYVPYEQLIPRVLDN